MELTTTVSELTKLLSSVRREGRTVGLVPTMGYLHRGHCSLMEAAARECDEVLITVFVNPLQFAEGEDFETYPRDLERDMELAAASGATVAFVPSVAEMYPGGEVLTTVTVSGVSEGYEGAVRPGHFAGVATVVAKLFSMTTPDRAYFGEKDYQQVVVVRRMVTDLSMGVDVVACPTIREPDGLAMSSRNTYLSDPERRAAPTLHAALRAGASLIESGERDPAVVRATMEDVLAAEPLFRLDYLDVVDADTMRTPERLVGELRLIGAATIGRARLLDNIGVRVDG